MTTEEHKTIKSSDYIPKQQHGRPTGTPYLTRTKGGFDVYTNFFKLRKVIDKTIQVRSPVFDEFFFLDYSNAGVFPDTIKHGIDTQIMDIPVVVANIKDNDSGEFNDQMPIVIQESFSLDNIEVDKENIYLSATLPTTTDLVFNLEVKFYVYEIRLF